MIEDFLALIFPKCCLACDDVLSRQEEYLCSLCRYKLPKTEYHLDQNNVLHKRFWGKVPVVYAFAYLRLTKNSSVQNIIHKIKYKGIKDCAKSIGCWYGEDLKQCGFQSVFDIVVSVPMHKEKLKKRGYNQSELFAEGLAEILNLNFNPNALQRVSASLSQTLKGRFDRWLNVKDIYKIQQADCIRDRHVLLVDDVVTSGATLEACARELLNNGAREVSIITMASAQ